MSAYRTTEPRSPPRVLSLRLGRGRSAVLSMVLGAVGVASLALPVAGLSIRVGPGLARFISGVAALATARPGALIGFAAYALGWFALFLAGVQTWRLRVDVEHHEVDDRLVFTWIRKPFRTRRLEVPRADITDVRVVVDQPERASSTAHIVLVTPRETIRLGPSTIDDHAADVAKLRAFLRLDRRGAPRARVVASAPERATEFAPESADRASRAKRS